MPDVVDTNIPDLKAAKRQFAVLGWAVFAILAVTVAGQYAASVLTWLLWPQGDGPGWLLWACSFVPLYLFGVPAGLLILRKAPAALHIFVNTMGGVVAPALLNGIDAAALQTLDPNDTAAVAALLPRLIPLLLYMLAMLVASLAGLVALCVQLRRLHFDPAPQELPRGARAKTVFLNPGMLLFIAGTLVLIATTFVG